MAKTATKTGKSTSKRGAKSHSLVDTFFDFIEQNPKLASSIAFEIGCLAGTVSGRAPLKRLAKLAPDFSAMIPQFAQAAFAFLPAAGLLSPAPARARKSSRKTR